MAIPIIPNLNLTDASSTPSSASSAIGSTFSNRLFITKGFSLTTVLVIIAGFIIYKKIK